MSSLPLSGADRVRYADSSEFGEIQNLSEVSPALKSRTYLLPQEEAASLPPPLIITAPAMLLLNRMLGARLTFDNPAWSGDPLPRMRALQRKLIEQSLTRPPGDRTECMDAIRLVEQAVQLRMRWQQMRKSDAEADLNPQDEDKDKERDEETSTA
ncbi:hypothetical protein [Collimonas sp.]|uniref:hypothetical protein n=1 Tax=Collimonas sp. TaxID=1963772 RepID=UPI002B8EFBA2|nr:hypothetical protein [Collimonas sp.]HWW05965.1 hypothetical protein [Collimonas sp.]